MSYLRVLPRDAFNESSLLKCIGKLTLLIHDGKLPEWSFSHDNEAFQIEQDESDGSISVANIEFVRNGERVRVCTPLNSRRKWPAMAYGGGLDGEFIFNDAGEWSPES